MGILDCLRYFVFTCILWKVGNYLQKILPKFEIDDDKNDAKKKDSQKIDAGKKTAPQLRKKVYGIVDSVCKKLLDEGIFNHVSRITYYLLIASSACLLIKAGLTVSDSFLGESPICMVLYLLAWCYVLPKLKKYFQDEPTLAENYLFTAATVVILILIGLVGAGVNWYNSGNDASTLNVTTVSPIPSVGNLLEACEQICEYRRWYQSSAERN